MTIVVQAFFLVVTILAAVLSGTSRAWPSDSPAITIVIRPAVTLDIGKDATDLTLDEIVDPATVAVVHRNTVMRHLRSIVLTDRPGVGEDRIFSEAGLEAVVSEASRRLEAAGYSVDWKIPSRSHVARNLTFSREAAQKQIADEFATRCGGCDVILKQMSWPMTDGLKILSWRLAFRSERPRGSFSVPIEFELAGTKRTFLVSGQVEFYAQVPVTQRAIQVGEKILRGDYKTERRNISYTFDAAATPQDFEISVAGRGIALGEPIWKASLRREQQVKFGDPVRVQSGGDSWTVATDGIAQGAAALGESVRVKVGKTQKLVSGVLKEKGLVEIQ